MALMRVRSITTGVSGAPWYSNFYFTGDVANAQAAADRVNAWYATDAKPWYSTALTVTVQPSVAVIDPGSGQITAYAAVNGSATAGTANGALLPTASQLLIETTTGAVRNGRQVRGRYNLPGLTMTYANAATGGPTAVIIAASSQAFTARFITGNPSTPLVIYSRKSKTTNPITGVTTWGQFAVLRSRRD